MAIACSSLIGWIRCIKFCKIHFYTFHILYPELIKATGSKIQQIIVFTLNQLKLLTITVNSISFTVERRICHISLPDALINLVDPIEPISGYALHKKETKGRLQKKKMSNLGFWLKLGGGGVRGGFKSPTCYQVIFLSFKNDVIAPKHEKSLKIIML